MNIKITNLPLLLTMSRLIVSPLVMPVLIVWLWPMPSMWAHMLLGAFFIVLLLTDLFDGFLARWWSQETLLGQLLDPFADKFLIVSCLMALQEVKAIWYGWVIILVLRELFVSGVRYIAREQGVTVDVAWWGKLKMCLQGILIVYVLVAYPFLSATWYAVGYIIMLLTTVGLSVYSAYVYYMTYLAKVYRKNDF